MAGMIRTLLVLLCLTKSSIRKLQRWHPSLLWGTIKAFASENIKKKKWPPFLQSSRVCASTSVFGLSSACSSSNVFWGHFSPRFLSSRSRVFSSPYYSLSSYFLLNLSELIEKAHFQGWLLIFLLIFHWKKCLFNVISASIRIAIFTFS